MKSMFDQLEMLNKMWSEFWINQMNGAASAFDPATPPIDFAKQYRSSMLQGMAQQTEQFMRSPQFLVMMRQMLDASMQMRKQMNDWFTQAHHGIQGVARQDVDEVLQSQRHLEQRVLDRLDDLMDRMDVVSRRLDRLERQRPSSSTTSSAGEEENDDDEDDASSLADRGSNGSRARGGGGGGGGGRSRE